MGFWAKRKKKEKKSEQKVRLFRNYAEKPIRDATKGNKREKKGDDTDVCPWTDNADSPPARWISTQDRVKADSHFGDADFGENLVK